MRNIKSVLAAVAVVGIAVTGCSTGDEDPEAAGGDAATSTADTSSEDGGGDDSDDSDDGDGAASADLVDWAGEFCGTLQPLQAEIAGLAEGMASEPADADNPLAAMIAAFEALGPVFEGAASDLDAIGPPPVENGEAAFDLMVESLAGAGDTYADIQAQLEALDPAAPDFQAQVQEVFAEVGEEMSASSASIDAVFDGPEMTAAIAEAPECEGLDLAP